MNYLPFERRSRHQFIEQSIDKTEQALNHPEASALLGEVAHIALRDQLSHYYIPSVRHGVINFSHDIESEDIAIIASHKDEEFQYTTHGVDMTPTQRAVARAGLAGMFSWDDLLSYNMSLGTKMNRHYSPRGILGVTHSMAEDYEVDSTERFTLISRPLVDLRQTKRIGEALFHETVHVHQCMTKPLFVETLQETKRDRHLSDELEAYMLGDSLAPVFGHLNMKDRSPIPKKVNQIVRSTPDFNPEDPYRLTDSVRASLTHHLPYI